MASTSMNIRIDSDIKKQAQLLFAEFGLDMTTAVNMFLRQSIRQHGIPFELKLDIPNGETVASFCEGNKLLEDPNTKKYSNFNELLAEVLNEA